MMRSKSILLQAGWKKIAYDKLIQMLVGQITQPEKFFIMGGTYRIPQARDVGLSPQIRQ